MPETDKIRVCIHPNRCALEQLFTDGRWYQRGLFDTPEEAEQYGIRMCNDMATIKPRIWRNGKGEEITND